MQFSSDDLSKIFQQLVQYGIDDISIDSRSVKNNDLFVAINGENTDGHNYVKQAIENGASLAVVEHDVVDVDSSKLIKVSSSLEALDLMAKYNVSRCNARIIGVTGSVGKTTTRSLIYHLLKYIKNVDAIYTTRKNFNSKIGLPICVATMPHNTEIGVFEMGMGAFCDIRHLVQIVQPTVSVITTVCEAHLQYFNNLWEIAKAKSEIFETQIPQEYAIIPGDSPFTEFMTNYAKQFGVKNVMTFGKGDAEIISEVHNGKSTYIKAKILGKLFEYKINFDNVHDSLAAILAVKSMINVSLNELIDGLASFGSLSDRGGNYYIENRNIEIINDTYNACPTSLKAGIQAMSYKSAQRKILIVGDMLEIGLDSVHMHENISATVDKYGIDKVFACGEECRKLFNNLQLNKQGIWCENSHKLAKAIVDFIDDGDCVLVKGSHSMHMDYVVNYLKEKLEKK